MQAYKSFKKRFSRSNLHALFFSKLVNAQSVGIDKKSPMRLSCELDSEVSIILRKVANSSYKFTQYRLVLSSKGKGKVPRELNIPTVRDRLTLYALSELLNDVYGDICDTPHPQSVIDEVRNTLVDGNFTHCYKVDLSQFYSSVEHERILRLLKRKIRKKEIVNIIAKALETPNTTIGVHSYSSRGGKGIPEGLSISNRIANIYANQLDEIYSTNPQLKYFRYVDDILIFYNKADYPRLEDEVCENIRCLGLVINSEKTKPVKLSDESFDYLGYLFQPNGILSVRGNTVMRLEQKLESDIRRMASRKLEDADAALQRLNNRITGCRIIDENGLSQRYGWLYYYSRINATSLLAHLDSLVVKLCTRHKVDPMRIERVKRFKKAFYEIRFKSLKTKYIPEYDMRKTSSEKLHDLKLLFPNEKWESMKEEDVNRIYSRRIRKLASQLERDVGLLS